MTYHNVVEWWDTYNGKWLVPYVLEYLDSDGWSLLLGKKPVYCGNGKGDDYRIVIPKDHLPDDLVIDMADAALESACSDLDIAYNEIGCDDIVSRTKKGKWQ